MQNSIELAKYPIKIYIVNMDIRARILQLCCERNITPTELALASCLTQSTVNNLTSGRNKSATVTTIESICDGLDITLAEFFEVTRHPNWPPEAIQELIDFERQLIKKYKLDKKEAR